MTTATLRQRAGMQLVAPRGAVWAADLFAALHRGLENVGRRRAEMTLIHLAASHEVSDPRLAAELRAAASGT